MRFFRRRPAPEAPREPERRFVGKRALRRAFWAAAAITLVAIGYLLFGPLPSEMLLEAGSAPPYSQAVPMPDLAPVEPPGITGDTDPLPPDPPPAEMAPGSGAVSPVLAAVLLPAQPYVGPKEPEFTGSAAPAGTGLVDGVLFGRRVLGIHPELYERLHRVERERPGLSTSVAMIVAYRQGAGSHAQGLAVDINYFANPYVMHESGEAQRDAELGPVYERIATRMLGRSSVIPEEITRGTVEPSRTWSLFQALRDESRAMVGYFRLMQDRKALERYLAARDVRSDDSTVKSLQRQMMRDYVTLSGRPGPPVAGLEYPAPEPTVGDPPFAGDPAYRGPELGFMNLSEELVTALTDAGLRWGGTDMSANSGDLMHFYLPSSTVIRPLESLSSGDNKPGGGRK